MSAVECLDMMERPEWMKEAACRGMDPDAFFPDRQATLEVDREKAKRVCSNCPVRDECKAYGRNEEYGIWGGTDDDERWLASGGPDGNMIQRSAQRGYFEE